MLRRLLAARLAAAVDERSATGGFDGAVDAVAAGTLDPYAAVDSLLSA